MKEIYILRHGQTDLNLKGMVQGRGIDSSINKAGQEQARMTFEALKDVGLDRIYTSKLKRTHETVALFNEPKVALEGFDEISWGSQEGLVPTDEALSLYADTVGNWKNGNLDANLGGGESPNEVMARQKIAIETVLSNGDSKILICMHGRAMRILLSWLLNYDLQFMDNFHHSNCCYYKLSCRSGIFSVDDFCVTDHLN